MDDANKRIVWNRSPVVGGLQMRDGPPLKGTKEGANTWNAPSS